MLIIIQNMEIDQDRCTIVSNVITIAKDVHQINVLLFVFFKLLIDSVKFEVVVRANTQIRKRIGFGMGDDGGIMA